MKKIIVLVGMVFLVAVVMSLVSAADCQQDSDCEVVFTHCSCSNVCLKKINETRTDCAVECPALSDKSIQNCKCQNNKCVGDNASIKVCPQYSPTTPNWCKDGTIVGGTIDSNGCVGPPMCVNKTEPIPNWWYRNAYWRCYDGTEEKSGGETSCKSYETWKKYATDACEGKCVTAAVDYVWENGTTEIKCGVNTFQVYNKCNADIIEKPVCGNGICEAGEGEICEIPSVECKEGETCDNPTGKCYYRCPKDCKNLLDVEGVYGEKFKLKIGQEVKFKEPLLKIKFNTILASKRCYPTPPTPTYSRECTYKWDTTSYVNSNITTAIKAVVKDAKGNTAEDVKNVEIVESLNATGGAGGGGARASGEKLYVQITEPSSSIIEASTGTIVKVYAEGPNKIEDLSVYINGETVEFSDESCIDGVSGSIGEDEEEIIDEEETTESGNIGETKVRTIETYSTTTGKVVAETAGGGSATTISSSGGVGGGTVTTPIKCTYGAPVALLQVKRYEGIEKEEKKQKTEVVKIQLGETKSVFDVTISFLDYDKESKLGVFLVSKEIFTCPANCKCDENGKKIECWVEEEKCPEGQKLCPDGVCREKCEITNETAECDFGCLYQDKCLPYGIRAGGLYCDISGDMKTQLKADEKCENNFECSTNLCIDGKCISSGLIQRILSWFRRMFGKG